MKKVYIVLTQTGTILSRIIFTIVGLAGLWTIGLLFKERESAAAIQSK